MTNCTGNSDFTLLLLLGLTGPDLYACTVFLSPGRWVGDPSFILVRTGTWLVLLGVPICTRRRFRALHGDHSRSHPGRNYPLGVTPIAVSSGAKETSHIENLERLIVSSKGSTVLRKLCLDWRRGRMGSLLHIRWCGSFSCLILFTILAIVRLILGEEVYTPE